MQVRFAELVDHRKIPQILIHGNPHVANYCKTERGAAMVDFDRSNWSLRIRHCPFFSLHLYCFKQQKVPLSIRLLLSNLSGGIQQDLRTKTICSNADTQEHATQGLAEKH